MRERTKGFSSGGCPALSAFASGSIRVFKRSMVAAASLVLQLSSQATAAASCGSFASAHHSRMPSVQKRASRGSEAEERREVQLTDVDAHQVVGFALAGAALPPDRARVALRLWHALPVTRCKLATECLTSRTNVDQASVGVSHIASASSWMATVGASSESTSSDCAAKEQELAKLKGEHLHKTSLHKSV